ncbi:hypothetical protein T484DRAFT_1948791 [Baffinella frigidus]|nr:hypothetical protein T484DRAFT_1948791 [Cryptophyta sp. CCMP2293]
MPQQFPFSQGWAQGPSGPPPGMMSQNLPRPPRLMSSGAPQQQMQMQQQPMMAAPRSPPQQQQQQQQQYAMMPQPSSYRPVQNNYVQQQPQQQQYQSSQQHNIPQGFDMSGMPAGEQVISVETIPYNADTEAMYRSMGAYPMQRQQAMPQQQQQMMPHQSQQRSIGEQVTLGFVDEGHQRFDVILTRGPSNTQRAQEAPEEAVEEVLYASPGFSIQETDDGTGFMIANITKDSSAEEQGLEYGERLLAINGKSTQQSSEGEIKRILTEEYGTLVTLQTSARSVEVLRDCKAMVDLSPPRRAVMTTLDPAPVPSGQGEPIMPRTDVRSMAPPAPAVPIDGPELASAPLPAPEPEPVPEPEPAPVPVQAPAPVPVQAPAPVQARPPAPRRTGMFSWVGQGRRKMRG